MGFVSNRELAKMSRKPMANACTQGEWDSKCRELKITDLLDEDIEAIKEWIYSHYVPVDSFFNSSVMLKVKNPYEKMKIIYK